MAYTLKDFAAECRNALVADTGPGGREQVRQLVMKVLADPDFFTEQLNNLVTKERNVVYEDSNLGFCICVHVYDDAKEAAPHDHGPTWAIYGQADGETKMTDWRIVTPAANGAPAKIEQTRSYQLQPGDAHLYEIGDIHAPLRAGPTKLIRIEGRNTEHVTRTPLEAISP